MQALNFIKKLFLWFRKSQNAVADIFQSLEIKLKLSIIIVLVVVIVITTFSVPVLLRQRNILTEQVSQTCRIIVGQLSQEVRDIMLLKVAPDDNQDGASREEPQIIGTVQEKLEKLIHAKMLAGLEYAFAIDKTGDVLVKPDSFAVRWQPSRAQIDQLMKLDKPINFANDNYIEYYQPVFVRKSEGDRRLVGVVGVGFSQKAIQEPINQTKNLIFTYAALVIIISVWGIYFLAEKMVNQITALVIAAREVGMGNLDVTVDDRSKDELGQLAREFNNMVKHLREKLQMQKFVSKLTVQMIRESGGSRVSPAEGERQNVTILFSDVRNFTAIAERLEPEQIVRLINIYFHLQTSVIEKNGGIVDKFMGDQIMAIFPRGSMTENAITAAVEIQRGIRELNKSRMNTGEVILEVGIGINQGPAVLGNMGAKTRMDYTVIGDVVNLAARLCSIAKAGQIIAALSAVHAINGKYPTTRLQPIIVKGRSKAVDICEVDYDRDVIM